MTAPIPEALAAIVGAEHVRCDQESLSHWGRDWTRSVTPAPVAVVLPASRDEVAAVLRLCHERRQAVVPSGGRTGLAGGAVAPDGEVVLSLERMNRILAVDPLGGTIRVEAGVVTEAIQNAAAEAGLFFPIDLAAKGSSQAGGNVATNAGGLKFIRYAGTREQVLGLEVVLADGEILELGRALPKNNSGYDLKQLFIGSEGTLGVITGVTFRLVRRLRDLQLACAVSAGFDAVPQVLRHLNQKGLPLTAFEFFAAGASEVVQRFFPQQRALFPGDSGYRVLIEAEAAPAEMEEALAGLFAEDLVHDGVLAASSSEFQELWAARELITEALSRLPHVHKNDVSVPIGQLATFMSEVATITSGAAAQGLVIIPFGHVGDGNVHLNYVSFDEMPAAAFHTAVRGLEEQVFALLAGLGGSISAEHGIGLVKRRDLHYTCSQVEVAWMRRLKALFDPQGILNPGKIFSP